MKGYIQNARKAASLLFLGYKLTSRFYCLAPLQNSVAFFWFPGQRCLFCKHLGWLKALLVLIFTPELTEQNA